MLWNPLWKKPADPTLDDFIAWLEKQPADEVYDYTDPHHCPVAKFNQSLGREYKIPSIADTAGICPTNSIDIKMERLAAAIPYWGGKKTYGRLLADAKLLAAKELADVV